MGLWGDYTHALCTFRFTIIHFTDKVVLYEDLRDMFPDLNIWLNTQPEKF